MRVLVFFWGIVKCVRCVCAFELRAVRVDETETHTHTHEQRESK